VKEMKFNEKVFANALATFTLVLYLVCGFLVAVVPEFMMSIARSWFHGIDLVENWSGRAFPGNFFFGLVTAVVSAWLSGWFFAKLYNYFLEKK
jgi:hypothetical protein